MANPRPSTCYYETLGIARSADAEEIKRAFRKLALEWHPDKNAHRLDEATERFKLIQAAHAVVSDPNERAWYDLHSADILSGGSSGGGGAGGGRGGGIAAQLVNVFSLFSSAAYAGFGDDGAGFYAVFRGAFAAIALEEVRFAPPDAPPSPAAPSFEGAGATAAAVNAFYAHWADVKSGMHFAWLDSGNPNDQPNRFARRALERENETLRRAGRRERTEQLRALVAFVRRRDRRLISITADARRAAEAKEAARRVAAEAAAAERRVAREAARAAAALEPDEHVGAFRFAEVDDADEKLGVRRKTGVAVGGGAVGGGAAGARVSAADCDSDDAGDDLACALCGKSFKSVAAFENHARSRRHVKAVEAHELFMREVAGSSSHGSASAAQGTAGSGARHAGGDDGHFSDDSESESDSDIDGGGGGGIAVDFNVGGDGGSTDGNAIKAPRRDASSVADARAEASIAENLSAGVTGINLNSAAATAAAAAPHVAPCATEIAVNRRRASDSDDSDAARAKRKPNKTELRRAARAAARAPGPDGVSRIANPVDPDVALRRIDPEAIRAGAKGKPLAAFIASHDGLDLAKGAAARMEQLIGDCVCSVCGEVCASRNKLFQHIKKTGHASAAGGEDAPSNGKLKRAARKLRAPKGDEEEEEL